MDGLACKKPSDAGFLTDRAGFRGGPPPVRYEFAIGILESSRLPLDKVALRVYPLTRASHAIDVLAGRVPDETAICVSLAPGA